MYMYFVSYIKCYCALLHIIALELFRSKEKPDLKQLEEDKVKLNNQIAELKQNIKNLNDENKSLRYTYLIIFIIIPKNN